MFPRCLRPLSRLAALPSLRWRIAGLVSAATCVAVVVLVVRVHDASHAYEMDQTRLRARSILHEAIGFHSRTGAYKGTVARFDARGIPRALEARVHAGHRGTQFTDGRAGPAMWAARPVGRHTLSVRIPMGTTLADLGEFENQILWAGLTTAGLVVPVGALIAGRMSRKLRGAAGTARRIAAGDLDARIGTRIRAYDEITEICGAVDSMAASLQARLYSEQRFTADVAHELRTPLMGLVTTADLLPEGQMTDYVRSRITVLCALVEDLLEISRLDAGAEKADLSRCALLPLIDEAAQRAELAVTVSVEGKPRGRAAAGAETGVSVWTDPRRLERILTNLIVNAHRHGRPPVTVKVHPDGRKVTVGDRGPGFPAHLLEEGPQRFRTGARERGGGHGLGLTIALGQAHVIGAALEFTRGPEGGAQAVVRLPQGPSGGRTPH